MHTQKSSRPISHAHAPHAHAPHVRHVELDDGAAFVPDYREGFVAIPDGDAEAAGEEFIAAATSAEAVAESARDEVLADELEGLHIETLDDTDE
jgi:hypothetical protein